MACEHMEFLADVRVGRLSDAEGGPVTGYTAGVRVKCTQCGLQFRFIGLAAGSDPDGPRVSVDGTELRAPIEPATHERFAAVASYRLPSRGRN